MTPFDIASQFIAFEEDQPGTYFDRDRNIYTAYSDKLASGKPTVGPGLTGMIQGQEIQPGQEYSADLINKVFQERMQTDFDRLGQGIEGFSELSPNQQAAIMSLVHNVGYDTFKFKDGTSGDNRPLTNAFQALLNKDFDTFLEESFGPRGFNKSKGTFVQGLQNRRNRERELFEKDMIVDEVIDNDIDKIAY